MRKPSVASILFAAMIALTVAAPARAQTYYPFGAVNFGQAQSGIRFGVFGCYTNTSPPTYTNGIANPCSLTPKGGVRVALIDTAGNDVTYLPSITESATETAGTSINPTSAYLKAYGKAGSTTWDRLAFGQAAMNASLPVTVASNQPPIATNPQVGTSGGSTPYSTGLSTAAVFTAQIKGAAGQVYGLDCFNTGAAKRFVRLYDQTGSPGSGDAANIKWRGIIPADVANSGGSGFLLPVPEGTVFATGIGIRITGLIADNDTTALAANEINCNARFK